MIVWVVLAAASGEVAAQGPRFKLGPAIEVGRHHTFTQVLVAALGPDNRLAVSQPQDYSVLLFDLARPDSPVAVLGRRGQGPGEFSEPGGIGWIGKTLWVADRGRPRVEVFDPSGKVVASKFYDAPRSSSRVLRYIGPTALMRDSTVVYYPVVIGTIRDPAVFPEDPSFPVLLLRHQAPKADTIAQLRLLRGQLALRGDRHGGAVSGIASQPFSNLNFFHSGADGRRVLLVIQSEPESHEGRALVKVVSPTGAEIYRKVLGLPPRAVSNSEWDSLVTSWAKVYASDTWSTEQKARAGLREVLIRPKFHPLVSAAVLGRDGTVWLRLEHEHNRLATWLILSPEGKDLGSVDIPRGIRVMDATATRVVGVNTDSDDVDHVVWMAVLGHSSM